MTQLTKDVKKADGKSLPKILETILKELRLLRSEVTLLLPQEELEEYAHPERIRASYQKAVKKYPIAWK